MADKEKRGTLFWHKFCIIQVASDGICATRKGVEKSFIEINTKDVLFWKLDALRNTTPKNHS